MVYASVLQAPMDGAKVDERQHRRRQEDQGRDAGHAAAVRRRGGRRHGRGDAGSAATRSRSSGTPSGAKAAPFDSEKAKEEYARKGKDPNAEAMEAYKIGDADKALAGAAKTLEAAVLVGAHLPRPDGADERRRQGFRRRPVGGNLGRHAGAAARRRGGRGRAQDHAGQDQDQPATAGRRLRPAHLAGRRGAGGGDRQHRQEAGEADPHPRGRHRRGASAADDAPRA